MDLLIVIFAAIAAWAAGAVYYMVLSQQWLSVAGVKVDNRGKPENASAAPYILSGIAMVLVAGMIRHIFHESDIHTLGKGLLSGLGIGAFIVAPWLLINHSYAQRPVKLTIIDSGYGIIACGIMGLVIGGIT